MRFGYLLTAILLIWPSLAPAAGEDAAIRKALQTQVEAWNHGDIPSFVETYAEDCTFVGKQVLQGKAQLLARYKKMYPSSDAMGKLAFSHLTVRLLDAQAAAVTGEWHLERNAAGGGPVSGLFSLVWQAKNGAWRIVLDHTS